MAMVLPLRSSSLTTVFGTMPRRFTPKTNPSKVMVKNSNNKLAKGKSDGYGAQNKQITFLNDYAF
jgi:hypothetical protein